MLLIKGIVEEKIRRHNLEEKTRQETTEHPNNYLWIHSIKHVEPMDMI